MSNEKIASVKSNMEKYETYRSLKGRVSQAIKYGFYYEAILIDYALIEDRLSSFLYHMGLLEERTSTKAFGKTARFLKPEIFDADERGSYPPLNLRQMSGKIEVIEKILEWVEVSEKDYSSERYLNALKRQMESVDIAYLRELLVNIDEWRKYRNEVIHGLMNKSVSAVDENIAMLAVSGKRYSEELDNLLRPVKKGNAVRRTVFHKSSK